MSISPTASSPPTTDASRPVALPGRGVDAFSKALETVRRSPATAQCVPPSNVNALLLHELSISEKRRHNRDARRRGSALLSALTELQHSLLTDEDLSTNLERLSVLVSAVPQADDPALASIVRSIALRAAVELCRRQPI